MPRAKGWRFGTAQEFLGLSNEESAYVELRVRLADSLRQRRQKRNLSQVELARVVHSSQSRVAKMESGDPTVSLDLLIRSLLAFLPKVVFSTTLSAVQEALAWRPAV